jgi:predicted esterase
MPMKRDARPSTALGSGGLGAATTPLLAFAALCATAACEPRTRPSAGLAGASAAGPEAFASEQAAAPPPSAEPPGPPEPALPPALTSPGPFASLNVAGYGAAVVSLPLGARGRRPVLLATHGNYDRPEWQCEVWRGIVGNRAFVLCPRGVARSDSPSPSDVRFTYQTARALEAEIDAAFEALKAGYADHVDDGPVVYTGFSLGAIMGSSIVARSPARYPRAVLIEGGYGAWQQRAKAFAKGGGRRVLFGCGQEACRASAKQAAGPLEAAGVGTTVVLAKGQGHRYDGPVAEQVKGAFDWAVEGDARWAPRVPE